MIDRKGKQPKWIEFEKHSELRRLVLLHPDDTPHIELIRVSCPVCGKPHEATMAAISEALKDQ